MCESFYWSACKPAATLTHHFGVYRFKQFSFCFRHMNREMEGLDPDISADTVTNYPPWANLTNKGMLPLPHTVSVQILTWFFCFCSLCSLVCQIFSRMWTCSCCSPCPWLWCIPACLWPTTPSSLWSPWRSLPSSSSCAKSRKRTSD